MVSKKEFTDVMLAMHDPYHVPSTVMGVWAMEAPGALTAMSYQSGGSTYAGHGGSIAGTGGRSGDGLIVERTTWFVEHIPPLRMAVAFGVRIADVKWRVKLPLGIVGALLAPALLVGPNAAAAIIGELATAVAGSYMPLLVLALGFVMGWLTVPPAGVALALSAMVVGLTLALATIAGGLWIAYRIIEAWIASQ